MLVEPRQQQQLKALSLPGVLIFRSVGFYHIDSGATFRYSDTPDMGVTAEGFRMPRFYCKEPDSTEAVHRVPGRVDLRLLAGNNG
jgi:hypothetical protein